MTEFNESGRVIAPLEELRILCVEDNDGDFVLVREYLREASFETSSRLTRAYSLNEAIDKLESNGEGGGPFNVILLDLSLPDSPGSDTLIRITKVVRKIPVIILSGNEDLDLAAEMVKRGAQDYLPKHFLSSDMLLRSILYAMERQRNGLKMSALNDQLKKTAHDLKTAQMQLIQAEKLDSLGRLAAGVAHEVKNPLATLQMGVDFFRNNAEQVGANGKVMVDHMQDAIARADLIIRGMVDYSRSDSMQTEWKNINEIVRKALRMVGHEIVKHSITVESDLASPTPAAAVRIDEGKIEQVIINVLVNAMQAMASLEGERILKVRTFWKQLETIDRDLGLRDYNRLRVQDQVVVVEIRDQGTGIPEEKINRIFEPFYTTKPTGQGTGLGMSVAKNIVDLHRGHIEITNVDSPRGLRVRIFLKAYELANKTAQLSESVSPLTNNPT